MAETTSTFNNWVAGEISADVYGRYDTTVYRKGAEILRNFNVKVQGPLVYRPGFQYIVNTKNNKRAVLQKFVFNNDLAYVLEFTHQTIRFYLNGGLIMDPDTPTVPYEIETPYDEANDLTLIKVAQNADTMYIVHPKYQPRKLLRYGSTDWRLELVEAGGGREQIPYLYASAGTNVVISKTGNVTTQGGHEFYRGFGKSTEGFYFRGTSSSAQLILTCTFEEYLLTSTYTITAHMDKRMTGMQKWVIVTVDEEGTETENDHNINLDNEFLPTSTIDSQCKVISFTFTTNNPIKSISVQPVNTSTSTYYRIYQIQISDYPIYPFTTEGNYPRAVAFAQSRLWYGGTDNAIDRVWGSCGPDTDGTTHYDNFTTGELATDAVSYILAPPSGKVEAIEWISSNNKFLLIGTYGGVSKMTGGSDDTAITPTSVNVKQLTTYGVSSAPAETIGSMVYYVQRSGQRMREIKYYLADDAYIAEDKNLTSSDIIYEGLTRIQYCIGESDMLYGVRTDGVLVALTVEKSEGIAAWQRHYLGGDFKVEDIVSVPRGGQSDQLYVTGTITVDGVEQRFMLCQTDEVRLPVRVDFFTDVDNKTSDTERWYNAIYQKQLYYNYLDCSLTYDGSEYATQDLSIVSTDVEDEVLLNASTSIFSDAWEGHQIWGAYDNEGYGGGRYEIIEYISETSLRAKVLKESTKTVLPTGQWYLTAQTLAGLDYLEGKTVSVFASGQTHIDLVVQDGMITLDSQYSVITVGLKYLGVFQTPDIELSRATSMPQSSLSMLKRVLWVDLKFKDTLGARFGSSLYNLERMLNADTTQRLGMPPRPFTGIKSIKIQSGYNNGGIDDTEAHVVVVQDLPQPCTLLIVQPRLDVGDE